MRKFLLWKPIIGPVFALFLLVGCSAVDIFKTVEERGGDTADQAYALLAAFNEVDQVALAFAQNPNTPVEVKTVLKKLREPARHAVPLIAEAAKTYRVAQKQLDALAEPSTTEEVAAALTVLTNRFDIYAPTINAFVDYVNSVRE